MKQAQRHEGTKVLWEAMLGMAGGCWAVTAWGELGWPWWVCVPSALGYCVMVVVFVNWLWDLIWRPAKRTARKGK